ncbi:MAG: hypothetical protein ABEJ95_06435 [Candidatus Nanohalobium sp.]
MNDLLEAAQGREDDSSGDRYEKLKKEEAGTDEKDPARERYDELKEKAKKEYEEQERRKEEETDDEEDEEPGFVTY